MKQVDSKVFTRLAELGIQTCMFVYVYTPTKSSAQLLNTKVVFELPTDMHIHEDNSNM